MSKSKSKKTITEEALAETEEPATTDETPEASSNESDPVSAETEVIQQADDNLEDSSIWEEQIELAREEAARNLDNWQRTAAELANFKRRQEEQQKVLRDRIKGEVIQGVVSALDDLDLAFQNLPEELDGQIVGWVEGFRLVQRKLGKILDDQNVMPINTNGKFDPNFHEAVSYEDSEEHNEGDIIAELRKGYQIGSRIIRPALVRVAK